MALHDPQWRPPRTPLSLRLVTAAWLAPSLALFLLTVWLIADSDSLARFLIAFTPR